MNVMIIMSFCEGRAFVEPPTTKRQPISPSLQDKQDSPMPLKFSGAPAQSTICSSRWANNDVGFVDVTYSDRALDIK